MASHKTAYRKLLHFSIFFSSELFLDFLILSSYRYSNISIYTIGIDIFEITILIKTKLDLLWLTTILLVIPLSIWECSSIFLLWIFIIRAQEFAIFGCTFRASLHTSSYTSYNCPIHMYNMKHFTVAATNTWVNICLILALVFPSLIKNLMIICCLRFMPISIFWKIGTLLSLFLQKLTYVIQLESERPVVRYCWFQFTGDG